MEMMSIEDARILFPVGTRVLFPDPNTQEHWEEEGVVLGEPYPASAPASDGTVCHFVKIPIRNHGGIVADYIRLPNDSVLTLIREIAALKAQIIALSPDSKDL